MCPRGQQVAKTSYTINTNSRRSREWERKLGMGFGSETAADSVTEKTMI